MTRDRRLLTPLLITLAIAVVYAPVLRELFNDWVRDPNYSHGFLIPVISGFLVWRQRHELAGLPRVPSNLGVIGILLAAGMLILGAAGAEVFTQRVGFVLLLASIVLFLLGWQWSKRVAFPIAFLLLAIPLPYVLYYSITAPMQAFAAKCAVAGLQGIGVPAVGQGNIIHLPATTLEVAEACSGIRSLYSFLALGAVLAYLMPIPIWARLLVFLCTIPLSIVGNAFRVWGSGVSAYLFGVHTTEGLVHEFFGLIVFAATLGIFILFRKGARSLWRSES